MYRQQQHIVSGMNKDASPDKLKNTHVFDARNIRITSRNGESTTLTVTNEKGPQKLMSPVALEGNVVGSAAFTDALVIFTHKDSNTPGESGTDRIYVCRFLDNQAAGTIDVKMRFEGDLNLSKEHPVETLAFFETSVIQKVYFVDGINQPRVVSIYDLDGEVTLLSNPDKLNFVRTIQTDTSFEFKIEKEDTGGEFPAGTIQYCFTYFNKFAQQSAIVETSPLYFLSPKDRGLTADGSSNCSFKITIKSSDTNFDYIRLYSIVRTSENATPVVKIVGDYATSTDDVIIYDTGTFGSTVDSTLLLFLNGERFTAETLATKDNTLFVGNLKDLSKVIPPVDPNDNTFQASVTRLINENYINVACVETESSQENLERCSGKEFYDYPINNNLPSTRIKTFKAGESYRLGFVLQDEYGRWSEAIWVGDHKEEKSPRRTRVLSNQNSEIIAEKGFNNVGFRLTLTPEVASWLLTKGYKRIAPVVVYPNDADRLIICQGMLAGTVYNVGDRADNSPFAQADWRFRKGYSWREIPWEIQLCRESSSTNEGGRPRPEFPGVQYYDSEHAVAQYSKKDFVKRFREYFYRDPSILTFHSPEIEFSNIRELPSDCKLRIVGLSFSDINESKVEFIDPEVSSYLEAGSGYELKYSKIKTYDKEFRYSNNPWERNEYEKTIKGALAYPGFTDCALDRDVNTQSEDLGLVRKFKYKYPDSLVDTTNAYFDWLTYIWHRDGSLSNAPTPNAKDLTDSNSTYKAITGQLKKHTIAEFNYARTVFFDRGTAGVQQPKDILIEQPVVYRDITNTPLLRLTYRGKERLYYGDIDKVITPNFDSDSDSINEELIFSKYLEYIDGSENTKLIYGKKGKGYPIEASYAHIDYSLPFSNNTSPIVAWNAWSGEKPLLGREPVSVKYKTTPHAIIPLKGSTTGNYVRYAFFGDKGFNFPYPYGIKAFFWRDSDDGDAYLYRENVGISDVYVDSDSPYSTEDAIYVAELYREFSPERMNSRFGGSSQEALALNDWKVCGKIMDINRVGTTTILYTEGDTFVSRYDCLKAYPYTKDDQNSIVSIYSTELETRVNLDARYDRNRGLKDNTLITPENFNLVSRPTYEQTNQFFTYHSLDYDRYTSLKYPNMIAWSLEKVLGEDVDTWTNIKAMSTFDLDGEKGEVTALKTYKNEIYAFQRKGISQILFNSRVQIPTSDGQPIEITNGMKVQGKRYITEKIGVQNKWSIVSSKNALYFIDDDGKDIYRLSDSMENLTVSKGMQSWMESNGTKNVPWNPKDYNNIRAFHDEIYDDIYFTTKDESLVFSELANEFTSFMPYEKYPIMENFGGRFVTILNTKAGDIRSNHIWEFWKGDYNQFPNLSTGQVSYRPFSLTFIANDNPTYDKVFNNLEWESAEWAKNGTLKPLATFNKLRVWNRYQDTNEKELNLLQKGISILKKKFNIFRVQIPRADKNSSYDGVDRQRIRGTWAKFKLEKVSNGTDDYDKFELYSLYNDYFL